jgi:hypothetical protein
MSKDPPVKGERSESKKTLDGRGAHAMGLKARREEYIQSFL